MAGNPHGGHGGISTSYPVPFAPINLASAQCNKVRIRLCIPCASDITSVTVYSGPEESSAEMHQEKGKKDFTKIHEG